MNNEKQIRKKQKKYENEREKDTEKWKETKKSSIIKLCQHKIISPVDPR